MGTRNITMVIDKEGTTKVAQYGQWDGYPEGQGSTILKFLRAKSRREKLEKKLKRVKYVDENDQSIIDYNKRVENKTLTEEDKIWFAQFFSRDVCGDILENIANSKEKEIQVMDSYDEDTDQWVEWVYKVDFQKNILSVHYSMFGLALKEYKLDELPTVNDFVTELNKIARRD